MNLIKKNVLAVAVLLSFTAGPCITYCDANEDDFEAYFNGLGSDANFDNMAPTTLKQFTPYSIILTLLDMNIISLLQENLFLRTNPLNKRNILDQPMGALDRHYKHEDWILGANLFYNETNRCYFDEHCDAITSYLGIAQESVLAKLATTIEQVKKLSPSFAFDPLNAIYLLKNATVQERQTGLLFFGEKQLPTWDFSWKLPFYYLERNYWLTKDEQKAMEAEYGSGTGDQKDYLQHNFLVADKVGFGDLRLAADKEIFANNDDRFNFRVGAQVTIPTAFAITRRIMGNHFCLTRRQENVDLADLTGYHLDDLVNIALDEEGDPNQVFDVLKNLGIKALDRISAQLLEAPLGNSGHLGIGAYTKSRIPISVFIPRPWTQRLMYKGGMSMEYLLPKTEQRMFVDRTNPAAFDSRDFTDEDQSFNNMIFLEQQLVDKIYPFVYDAKVHPGIIFRWLGALSYESYHWLFNIGNDTWIRTKESFSDIQAPQDQLDKLEIGKAERLMGYQWKIVGSAGYKIQRKKHTWIFSVDGDYCFSQSGIGSDWTASLNVEVDF